MPPLGCLTTRMHTITVVPPNTERSSTNMSTNTRINAIATALVALALVLGAAFGSYVLGGTPTPTEAVVPATDSMCALCVDSVNTGGGGNTGNIPNPLTGGGTGTGGSGGGTAVNPQNR